MVQKVFISHCHQDAAPYRLLCSALDHAKVDRWDVAQLATGNPLAEGLRAAIDECEICIFLATTRSLESRWCLAELGAFWGAGKRVIIFVADPSVNESALPPQFKGNLFTDDHERVIVDVISSYDARKRLEAESLEARLGNSRVRVHFGRIEEEPCEDGHLIALPANEYFDDECIRDSGSALGAYVQKHFSGRIADFQDLIRRSLQGEACTQFEKTPGKSAMSYGVGKAIYLPLPLAATCRLALVSVTKQRANEGLTANTRCVFDAVWALHQLMANNRLSSLSMPVLCSGHGGLSAELSLVCTLIAIGDVARAPVSPIRQVKIVVFQKDGVTPPAILPRDVRAALTLAKTFHTAS